MGSPKTFLAFFVVIVFISATSSRATTVVIYNDLGGGLPLQYHCKSGDNDLGVRRLAPGDRGRLVLGQIFLVGLNISVVFSWGTESHYFDIYKQSRDKEFKEFGCSKCEWKIRRNGPCKLNKNTGMFDLCSPWNS